MSAPFGFAGVSVPDVRYLGRCFDAWVEFDLDEVRRRELHRLGGVTDRRTLEALANLPLGFETERNKIDPVALVMLDAAPAGLVEATGGRVVRRWSPALRLLGVSVESASLSQGVQRVELVASHAPRGVFVRSARPPQQSTMMKAAELGIGVAHVSADGIVSQLASPSRRAVRLGIVHWRLLETIFDRAIEPGVVLPERLAG